MVDTNMARSTLSAALLLVIAVAVGCATTTSGSGSTMSGPDPVKFSWTSSGNVSGSMTATLANGEIFRGQFFQATSSKTDDLGPQGPRWHREGDYDWGPTLESVPYYTGRVVATLSRPNGARMRCRFELIRPADGMAGGARGECQLPDGRNIDAQFPAA
jgi:hypothetical protein